MIGIQLAICLILGFQSPIKHNLVANKGIRMELGCTGLTWLSLNAS